MIKKLNKYFFYVLIFRTLVCDWTRSWSPWKFFFFINNNVIIIIMFNLKILLLSPPFPPLLLLLLLSSWLLSFSFSLSLCLSTLYLFFFFSLRLSSDLLRVNHLSYYYYYTFEVEFLSRDGLLRHVSLRVTFGTVRTIAKIFFF